MNILAKKSVSKKFLMQNKCEIAAAMINDKIELIEENLSTLCAERNVKLVKEHIGNLEDSEGRFKPAGMWKLRSLLIPREYDPPMAKRDQFGNIVTNPNTLKKLYLDTYVKRLEHRKIDDKYVDNYNMKMKLWKLRFHYLLTKVTSGVVWISRKH